MAYALPDLGPGDFLPPERSYTRGQEAALDAAQVARDWAKRLDDASVALDRLRGPALADEVVAALEDAAENLLYVAGSIEARIEAGERP